jgi:hypothetical protein
MSNVRWQPRIGTGLPPGVVRINDSAMIMLRAVAKHLDPKLGEKLFQQTLALHKASTQGLDATKKAAQSLHKMAQDLIGLLASRSFDAADVRAMAAGVVAEGMAGEFADYAGAEQATMALSSIIEVMKRSNMADAKQLAAMNTAIEACYKAVEKDEEYRPQIFMQALAEIAEAILQSKN